MSAESSLIYEYLLRHCAPLRFEGPWSFLPVRKSYRAAVPDPAQTLTALRQRFSEAALVEAGVLETAADGSPRLVPELTNPQGALLALRAEAKGTVQCLLTARGCLPRTSWSLAATLHDPRTVLRLRRTPILIAALRIREVALLHALGLPATLAQGISRYTWEQLRALDARFGCADFVPPPGGPDRIEQRSPPALSGQAPTSSAGPAPITLALLGWSPLTLAPQPAPLLRHALTQLAAARHHLGLPFAGVMAWQLAPRDLDNLHYRLRFGRGRLVREYLQEQAESLVDFERLAEFDGCAAAATPAANALTKRAELLAALTDDRAGGPGSQRVRQALAAYEELVQEELVGPLQAWALASPHPVYKSAGMELANVAALLHTMSPLLADLLHRRFGQVHGSALEPIPTKSLGQYLALLGRFGNLVRDLQQWRNR